MSTEESTIIIDSSLHDLNAMHTASCRRSFLDKSVSMIENSNQEMSYSSADLKKFTRNMSESEIGPVKQNYEDLVTCTICTDQFDSARNQKLPKILPCQHTYCVECIKNMLQISKTGCIDCPQCKFKIDNLKDALDLPTSRIVLALLEKDQLNYQGYAACPCCRQIRNLEVCFECSLPLCNNCIASHFESWKKETHNKCLIAEENLEKYKQQIDSINPFITKNFENIQSVKDEIDQVFTLLFQRLNTEKEVLLRTINDIKDENSAYIQFKKDTAALIAGFRAFRERNENYEKKSMANRMKKINLDFEQLPKIETEFSELTAIPFKVLEKFEKKTIHEYEKFSGALVISELNIGKNNPINLHQTAPIRPIQNHAIKETLAPVRTAPSAPPVQLKSSASFASLNQELNKFQAEQITTPMPINGTTKPARLSEWENKSYIKPEAELTVPITPSLMTSFETIVFCMDFASNLTIYESNSIELREKNKVKISVPNPKAISASQNYFGVSYFGPLKKEQSKGIWKNLPNSGVILFTRQEFVVCSIHDKIIDLSRNNESFKQPTGLALTDKYLFVSDRELRSVFKFNLKNSSLMQRIPFKEEPFSICINRDSFLISDFQSSFHLFDIETCALKKSKNLKPIDQIGSMFATVITDDGLVIVKNSENQLTLLDSELEQRAFFNEIQAKILSISFIQNSKQMLIIGCVNSSQQNKLYNYVV